VTRCGWQERGSEISGKNSIRTRYLVHLPCVDHSHSENLEIMCEIYQSTHRHTENPGSVAATNETGTVLAMAVMMAMESSREKRANAAHFDTDTTTIGVDNRCTACISDKREHFMDNLILGRKVIKGFHGSRTTKVMSATMLWKWLDGNRLEHDFKIPGSYFIPEGKCQLLSPQHWAQKYKKATGMQAWEETDHEACTLYWEGRGKSLTIPLGDKDNVATLQLTPGYTKYHSFCDGAPTNDKSDPIIMYLATPISDNEGNEEDDQVDNWDEERSETRKVVRKEARPVASTTHPSEPVEPTATNFDLDGGKGEQILEINIVEEDVQSTNLAAELLRIHHHMGHAPFSKLQEIAKQGALLARLKKCLIPMCKACAYGKASRKAWRGRPLKKGASSQTALQAGDIVSVDQTSTKMSNKDTGQLPQDKQVFSHGVRLQLTQ
jgi:hypothetical protein